MLFSLGAYIRNTMGPYRGNKALTFLSLEGENLDGKEVKPSLETAGVFMSIRFFNHNDPEQSGSAS